MHAMDVLTHARAHTGVIEEASDAFLDVPLCVFFPFLQLLASLPLSIFSLVRHDTHPPTHPLPTPDRLVAPWIPAA